MAAPNLEFHVFPNGLTVKELKKIINAWPDTDIDGQPYEVWVGKKDDMLSNVIVELWPLNKDGNGSDILLLSK